jgi:sulfonate dioxygenase
MTRYPPLEPFDYVERAKGADSTFNDLLTPESKIEDITAALGAEVTGVQLSQLSDKGKDQLALLAAEKKVLGMLSTLLRAECKTKLLSVFRDQDFSSLPIREAVDFCRYFGRLFLHPHSGAPKGHPEVHLVHRRAGNTIAPEFFTFHTHSMAWHSDNSYEVQPPGITLLYALEVPAAGGDTIFVNMEKAYERLSPDFRERLKGLEAVHTARDQTARAVANGGYVRREPIDTVHPVVRTHPATGKKALFVNPQFTRQIVGFKKEESDYLLKFLYEHLTLSHDLQCRVKWTNRTVVVLDVSLHILLS